MVQFKSFRIPLSLVDNGSGLNVCPLRIALKLGFKAEDITPTVKRMTSFDNTHHDSLGILIIPFSIGLVVFDVEFYVVDLEPSFNLLLGSPWLHKHLVIPSTLHCMIKFRWGDEIIVVMAESFDKEPVNAISSVSQQTVRLIPSRLMLCTMLTGSS